MPGKVVYKLLDLDSDILGFKTAKIDYLKGSIGSKKILVRNLLESFKKAKVEYVTFRINARDVETVNILEEEGFKVVDGYLVLMKEVGKENEEDLGIKIREAKHDDIRNLQDLIAPTFIYSRFFKDLVISKHSAIRMHKVWIENCIKGKAAEKVYVAEIDGECAGFIALDIEGGVGHIPLIGVTPKFRGKKISKALTLHAISEWFKKKGVQFIRIETQLANIPATRAYEGIGFKLEDSFLTLRWTTRT